MVRSSMLLSAVVLRLASARTSHFEESTGEYNLDWSAEGKHFFDDMAFADQTYTMGSAVYLQHDAAVNEGVIETHDSHAILRTGRRLGGSSLQRFSGKVQTKQRWTYFLAVMKFHHVPHGSGVWPAFWMNGPGTWPAGGELDVLEYANNEASKISLHTAESNRCKLDSAEVNKFVSMPDRNEMDNDCVTDYHPAAGPIKLGCAPTHQNGHHTPGHWASNPGTMAVEWTKDFVKVFYIPEAETPKDLEVEVPEPNSWDKWVVSYFPFAASEANHPGSCPHPESVLKPQQLILNVELCGDWAGYTWYPQSGDPDADAWRAKVDGKQCTRNHNSGSGDCCTQYVGQSKLDKYFADQAFFNISYLKVFKQSSAPTPPPAPTPACTLENKDPWASGAMRPCCSGLTPVVKDWDRDGRRYFKCPPAPTPVPTPPPCTGKGLDPWMSGSLLSCCSGLASVVKDWDGDGRAYYKCMPSLGLAPVPAVAAPVMV